MNKKQQVLDIIKKHSVNIDENSMQFNESNNDNLGTLEVEKKTAQQRYDEVNELRLSDKKSRFFESRYQELSEEYGFVIDLNKTDEQLESIANMISDEFDESPVLSYSEVVDVFELNDYPIDMSSIDSVDEYEGQTYVVLVNGEEFIITNGDELTRIDESTTKQEIVFNNKDNEELGKKSFNENVIKSVKKSIGNKSKKSPISKDDYESYNESFINEFGPTILPDSDVMYDLDDNERAPLSSFKPQGSNSSIPINGVLNEMSSTEVGLLNEMIDEDEYLFDEDEYDEVGEEYKEAYDAYLSDEYDADEDDYEYDIDEFNDRIMKEAGTSMSEIINSGSIDRLGDYVTDERVKFNREKRMDESNNGEKGKKGDDFISRLSKKSFY
jgi:hypothetical protein